MTYKGLVCGGTFDHFHVGHEAFLSHALSLAEHVYIGLTTDTYTAKKHEDIESYEKRLQSLESFFKSKQTLDHVTITPITHNMIPQIWPQDELQCILVTEDTREGADALNTQRIKAGKQPLIIEHMAIAYTGSQQVSSSAIRSGIIDRNGVPFLNPRWLKKSLRLPDVARPEFQKVFGTLLQEDEVPFSSLDPRRVVTVGDVVSQMMRSHHILQHVAIVDLIVERRRKYNSIDEHGFSDKQHILRIKNDPSTINPSFFELMSETFASVKPVVILVDGEEDLSVLPAIICAPLNTVIFYGQPGQGAVMLIVDEKAKKHAKYLLSLMDL